MTAVDCMEDTTPIPSFSARSLPEHLWLSIYGRASSVYVSSGHCSVISNPSKAWWLVCIWKNHGRICCEGESEVVAAGSTIVGVFAPHIVPPSHFLISCFGFSYQPKVIQAKWNQCTCHHCSKDCCDPAWKVNYHFFTIQELGVFVYESNNSGNSAEDTVKTCVCNKKCEKLMVSLSHAIANPRAMMIYMKSR